MVYHNFLHSFYPPLIYTEQSTYGIVRREEEEGVGELGGQMGWGEAGRPHLIGFIA